MNKQELIESLNLCQSLNVTIPVDKVIEMINNLDETPVQSSVGISKEKIMEFVEDLSEIIKNTVEENINDHIDDYDIELNGREIEVTDISVNMDGVWRYVKSEVKDRMEEFIDEILNEEEEVNLKDVLNENEDES
jgi:hypothetical protein